MSLAKLGLASLLALLAVSPQDVAQPGGGKPLPFSAVKLAGEEAVLDDEKHDHPQGLRNERTVGGVSATVSRLDGSEFTTYAYRRLEK